MARVPSGAEEGPSSGFILLTADLHVLGADLSRLGGPPGADLVGQLLEEVLDAPELREAALSAVAGAPPAAPLLFTPTERAGAQPLRASFLGLHPVSEGSAHLLLILEAAGGPGGPKRWSPSTRRRLIESAAKSRAIYGAIPDLIVHLRRDGMLLDIQPGGDFSAALPFADLVGKSLEAVLPRVAGETRRLIDQALATGETQFLESALEVGGAQRQFEARIVACGPDEVVAIVRDTTRRSELDEQARQSLKMETLFQLAGGLAHDFNNILAQIGGHCELLLRKLLPNDPLRHNANEIEEGVARAAALTGRLLALSRRQAVEPQEVDLNAVVARAAESLGQLWGEEVALSTVLDPDPGWVWADPAQLEQVVLNLAVNAREAMPPGGHLWIRTARLELDETLAAREAGLEPGPYVMLAVSDEGRGMDAPTLARIFDPFFSTKEPGRGAGLGLATVYAIVEQCRGRIFVDSEPGQGSTFRVLLPRVEPSGRPEPLPAVPGESLGGRETVLVVEDEDSIRDLIREVLEAEGYGVLLAADAEEAQEVFRRADGRVDLLLTDVVMPGLNGFELAAILRSVRRELKVLLVSGNRSDAALVRGVADGATQFLQKPFSLDTLLQRVRAALAAEPSGPPE
jgi:signal transduction histidine kinase/ActR/RegA family two-component response regulator